MKPTRIRTITVGRLALTVALLGLFTAAAACSPTANNTSQSSSGTTPDAAPEFGGSLSVGIAGETDSWSPQNGRWSPSSMTVARAIFDPLATADADGNIKPYLAESFTPNKDFTQWDIKIRPGIKFHNGETMGAGALAYNLEALRKSPITAFPFKPITNLEKLDDLTVRVSVNQPWGRFPAIFATQTGYMAAPAQLTSGDNRHPIGTGPFEFKDWKPDSELSVTRNPNYWQKDTAGRQLPYLDSINFKVLSDESSRVSAFTSGDVNVIHSNKGQQVAGWSRGQDIPGDGTHVLIDTGESDELATLLNSQTGVFTDLRLRQAVGYATDRQAITDQVSDGVFKPADQPYRPGSFWHIDDVGYPTHDVAKAQSLVNSWKADHNGDTPAVHMLTSTSAEDLGIAQQIQAQWKEAGIDLTVSATEETAFAKDLLAGSWDAITTRYWNKPDPDSEYVFWHGSNIGGPGQISLNLMRYSNPTIDAALDAGRASGDPEYRKQQYAIVWREWAKNMPILWVFHSQWAMIAEKHVNGLGQHKFPDGTPTQPVSWGSTFFTSTWVSR